VETPPLFCALTRQGLNPIMPTYNPSQLALCHISVPLTNIVSMPAVHCFFPSSGHNLHQCSFCLPTKNGLAELARVVQLNTKTWYPQIVMMQSGDSRYSVKCYSDLNLCRQTHYYTLHCCSPGGDNVMWWSMILHLILKLRLLLIVTVRVEV